MQNKNSNRGANYSNNVNKNSYQDNAGMLKGHNRDRKKGANTSLLVAAIILSTIAIAVSVSAVVVLTRKNVEFPDKSTQVTAEKPDNETAELVEKTTEDIAKEAETSAEPVKKYVNCDTSLSLREGPAAEYRLIMNIPAGEAVDLYEYSGDYVKVRYNGNEGYVNSEYLSDTRPYVWEYDEDNVKEFVEDVLYAYVDAINYDDVEYVTKYLGGEAVQNARNTHNQVTKVTNSEEVLYVNCHSVNRISRTKVTVVRESTIRVTRHSGEVKDVTEKYLSTVENTGNGMKVIEFQAIK